MYWSKLKKITENFSAGNIKYFYMYMALFHTVNYSKNFDKKYTCHYFPNSSFNLLFVKRKFY